MVYGDLQILDIVIFAGIAVFLVFRLKKVLGKRTGFEKQHNKRPNTEPLIKNEKKTDIVPDLPENLSKLKLVYETIEDFKHKNFLDGAKMAFETIFNAFNKGDKKTLKKLLTTEVYKSFEEAIDANKINPDYQFYSLNIKDITDTSIEGSKIKVCINFISEQFTNGDESTVIKKQDIWTFEKTIKSKDPNWLLSST